jgi:GntR family transcriptional regulator, transcriptional repressor for pyruvate dehydrogenase complex
MNGPTLNRSLGVANLRPYVVLSAPRQVAAGIKREILEGALKPGDKLPSEEELAVLFGVSRPTVRAGLQELCTSQILVVQRGRGGGYRVGEFSFDGLETSVTEFISLSLVVDALKPEQFFEVRSAHELLSAESAARRRTQQQMTGLDELANDVQRALDDDPREAFELDLRFHRLLAEATANPLAVSFEAAMIAVLHRLLGDGRAVAPRDSLGSVNEIIEAVREQDGAVAREAMRRHLEHSRAHYGISPDRAAEAGD